MRFFISFILCLQVALFLLLPSYSNNSGHAYYTYLTYILIPLSYIWNKSQHIFNIYPIYKDYLKATIVFVILLFINGVLSIIFGDTKTIFGVQFLFSNIILIFYIYIFLSLLSDDRMMRIVKITILISSVILVIYSFFSYITETNIYADLLRIEQKENAYMSYSDTRGIKFRISGNVMNPVFFSGELMLLLGFCCHELLYIANKYMKLFLIVLIASLLISAFFTGSKSGIIPAIFICLYTAYHILGRKKMMMYSVIVILSSSAILPILSNLTDIDFSILFKSLDVTNTDVGGSSANMRIKQMEGLSQCVGDNILFGNGGGWTEAYLKRFGGHPVLLGFESIIFSGFCNGGLFALFVVYPVYLWKLYKVDVSLKTFPMYKIVLMAYYFFIFATGNGSIKYLYLILSIIIIDYVMSNKNIKLDINKS